MENGKTFIHVNGRRFLQCIRLILNIQKKDVPLYDKVESIDEAADLYSNHIYQNRIVRGPGAFPVPDATHDITPEQEFWGHCSNLQAWIENNYDTRILKANISFPLLRELTQAGDPIAKKVFKEEIALRLESGYPNVVQYLINQGYMQYLSPEEFKTLLETTNFIENISSEGTVFRQFLHSCVMKFPDLLETLLLKIMRLPQGKHIVINCIKGRFKRRFYRMNSKFLSILKSGLETIMPQCEDKLHDDLFECILAIENTADERNLDLDYWPSNDNPRPAENMFLDKLFKAVVPGLENEANFNDEILDFYFESKCSYCGKKIPPEREVCYWCGHQRKDDDDGFFPYPYIFKPPDGGGALGENRKANLKKRRVSEIPLNLLSTKRR